MVDFKLDTFDHKKINTNSIVRQSHGEINGLYIKRSLCMVKSSTLIVKSLSFNYN